jgi:hypothetical protein
LLQGIDPVAAKVVETSVTQNSFEAVAREWHAWKAKQLSSGRYAQQVLDRLEANVFPEIGLMAGNRPSERSFSQRFLYSPIAVVAVFVEVGVIEEMAFVDIQPPARALAGADPLSLVVEHVPYQPALPSARCEDP